MMRISDHRVLNDQEIALVAHLDQALEDMKVDAVIISAASKSTARALPLPKMLQGLPTLIRYAEAVIMGLGYGIYQLPNPPPDKAGLREELLQSWLLTAMELPLLRELAAGIEGADIGDEDKTALLKKISAFLGVTIPLIQLEQASIGERP